MQDTLEQLIVFPEVLEDIIAMPVSAQQFTDTHMKIVDAIQASGLDVWLGEDTTAKTLAGNLTWEWFSDNGSDFCDHYVGFEFDDFDDKPMAFRLLFRFEAPDRTLALMFKLAHG